jgi:hypothetical protein
MKHFRKHFLKTAVVVSALAIATMVLAQETKADQKPTGAQQVKPTTLPGRPDMVIHCPDPAAQRIDFSIVSRTDPWTGRVRITGVVKNIGGAYESKPGHQDIRLFDASTGVELAKKDFANLAPGQEVTVTFERSWNSSSPSEGEFPPTYKLVILYDPDGTKDCNGNNNEITRSGADINAMFQPMKKRKPFPANLPKPSLGK